MKLQQIVYAYLDIRRRNPSMKPAAAWELAEFEVRWEVEMARS